MDDDDNTGTPETTDASEDTDRRGRAYRYTRL